MPASFVVRAITFLFDVVITAGSTTYNIIQVATYLVLGALFQTKVEDPFSQSSTSPGRGSIQPWQYIYGTVRTAGVSTFVHVSGENNQFLNLIHILAAHQVEEIGQLYYNHEPIQIDGSGDAVGRFANFVHIDKKLGTPKQEAITNLIDITAPVRTTFFSRKWFVITSDGAGSPDPNGIGIKLDGAYQFGETTSNVTNPTDITIGIVFRVLTNKNTTILSFENGWRLDWKDDGSISFIDGSGTEINSGVIVTASSPIHRKRLVMIGISGGDIRMYIDQSRIGPTDSGFNSSFDPPTRFFYPTVTDIVDATTSLSYNKGASTGKVFVGSREGTSGFFGGHIAHVVLWNSDHGTDPDWNDKIVDTMDVSGIGDIDGTIAAWSLLEASGDSIDQSVASGRNDLIIKGAWTTLHTLNSRSYVRQRLTWNKELFSRGVPPAAYDTKGKLVPDFLNEQTVTSVANAADEFTISGGHGFSDDDVVELYTRTGVLPDGAEAFIEYYVDSTGANTFKLYDAPAADTTRSLIALSDDGTAPVIVIQRVWSANAARCTVDYLHDPHIGMHVGFEEFDETALLAAIDVCDDDVALDLGGTEKRYEANGVLSSSKLPRENIQSLLTSMAGTLVYVGGKWFLYAGAFRTPTLSFDEDDFVSDMGIQALVPRSENFNAVRGVFVYPNSNWEPTDFPPVTSATFEAEDQGERVYEDINLPFTTSFSAAQRLAKIILFRQRESLTVRTKMKLSAFQAQPGNVIKVSNDRMGWTDKEFEVLSGQLSIDTEKGMVYEVTLQETNSGVYSWTTEESEIGFLNNSALPDVFQIQPPEFGLRSGTVVLFRRLDGTIMSRIAIDIVVADAYVLEGGSLEIQFRNTSISAAIWEQFGLVSGNSTIAYILDVGDGDTYDVRVRSISSLAVKSDWFVVEGHVVVGKLQPPNDVENFSVTHSKGLVTFLWKENTEDIDLGGYVIRYHVQGTPTWGSGILLTDTVRTNSFITDKIPAGSWTMLIRARDTTKNLSENVTSFDIDVSQSNVVISSEEEAPDFDGTLVNFVRHVSNVLIPQGTQLVSSYSGFIGQASGVDFTKFCPDAFATSTYTADEVVLNTAGSVLLNANIVANVGPDETGEVLPQIQVNIDPDGTGYTGFVNFSPGEYTVKRVQFRVVFTNDEESRAVFSGMSTVVDEEPVSQTQQNVVIGSGGTTIIFAVELNTIPIVTPIVKGSTPLFPGVDNVTTAQADIQLWADDGTPTAGVVDININTSVEAS